MHAKVSYGDRDYGNRSEAPSYKVEVQQVFGGEQIRIQFQYDAPAEGFGAGDAVGYVTSVNLRLPGKVALAIAHAVQLQAVARGAEPTRFNVDERPETAVRAA